MGVFNADIISTFGQDEWKCNCKSDYRYNVLGDITLHGSPKCNR